ncbi:MAG TPA: hypothetical protein VFR17_14600 [Mycobacterium sp.]|nr:hypothetical protein [Mycobacterium sp.]
MCIALGSAALGGTPTASADDLGLLDIPGLRGPIGPPTNVQTIDGDPFFGYRQEDELYNVVNNSNNVIGSFTDTNTTFGSPSIPPNLPPIYLADSTDVISNSTYSGLANGATEINDRLITFVGIPGINFMTLVLLGNDYVNNPGIATSDTVTLFNAPFTLWDSPADTASAAAADSSGLTDLAGLI